MARAAKAALLGGAGWAALAGAAAAQSPTAVSELVVTAAGFEQKLTEAPASITVIPRAQIEQKRAGNLAEVLADVEGVDIGDSAGKTGGLNISIRGMPSDYTLVLVDGRRQNAAGNVTPNGFGETSTSFLPPLAAIERVEVVRGPMSTLYGSDAMGGVINIITRKVARRWIGEASLNGTLQQDRDFGGFYGGDAYVNGPIVADRLGLAVRGSLLRRGSSDLSYVNAAGAEVEVSKRGPSPVKSNVSTLGARLTLTPGADHDLWIDVDSARQSYDNTAGQLGTLGVQGGYAPKQKFNRDQAVLAHTWRIGDVGPFERAQLDSNLTKIVTETIGRTIPPGTPGRLAGSARALEAESRIVDSKLTAGVGGHTFTLGGQHWEATMTDGVAPAPYEHTQWALFVEDEWRFHPALALTLGVRRDDHSTFGGATSPRAYLVWNASDQLTVKGGVSRGFKTPRLDQLADGITGFGGQGTIPLIGSPGLKPETSTTTEVGIYFDNLAGFSANLTLFNNTFEDKIASGPGLPNCSFAASPNRPGCVDYGVWPRVDLFGQSVNVDEAVTRGGEIAGRWAFAQGWSSSLNYTYTESEQKSGAAKGQPLVNTPRHMLNGQLRWAVTPKLSAWVRGEYRSKRFRGLGDARNQLGDYKAYGLAHLGGAYEITETVTLNATVYNLFNKDFVSYRPYRTAAGATAYAAEYSNNQEPRRLWVSLKMAF